MKKKKVVIAGAVRTPIGAFGGNFRDVPAKELLKTVFAETLRRAGIDPKIIDEVIAGNIAGPSDATNITRIAALMAGVPIEVPGFTVTRNCAAGIQAITSACQAIWAGDGEIYLVGGTESMSQIPYLLKDARWGKKIMHGQLTDGMWEGLTDPICNQLMGRTAENVAEKYGITREEVDKFAIRSHQKSYRARQTGKFKTQIVPVHIITKDALGNKKEIVVSEDEGINPGLTLQIAAMYPTIFKEGGIVTPANACGTNDGAADMIVLTEKKAKELGIEPQIEIVSYAYAGLDPAYMGERPILAIPKALKKAGFAIPDIDFFEINEAFAAQCLPCQRVLEIPEEKLNIHGGAIALGHPVGATGAILTTKLIHILKEHQAKYGVVSMCVGGGQGGALIIKNYTSPPPHSAYTKVSADKKATEGEGGKK